MADRWPHRDPTHPRNLPIRPPYVFPSPSSLSWARYWSNPPFHLFRECTHQRQRKWSGSRWSGNQQKKKENSCRSGAICPEILPFSTEQDLLTVLHGIGWDSIFKRSRSLSNTHVNIRLFHIFNHVRQTSWFKKTWRCKTSPGLSSVQRKVRLSWTPDTIRHLS